MMFLFRLFSIANFFFLSFGENLNTLSSTFPAFFLQPLS